MHWCRFRWQYGEYNLDHITIVMILVMKLTSFAFDFSDSYILSIGSSSKKTEEEKELSSSLSPEQAKRLSILHGHYPNILEFLSYCFMYPGVLTGPAVFYPEYKSFLDGTFFLPPTSSPQDRHALVFLDKNVLNARTKRVISLFVQAIIFIICNVILTDLFTAKFLTTPEFGLLLWPRKTFYLHMVNFTLRSKYYLAWLLAEAAYVLIGIGYRASISGNPENNMDRVVHSWDRYEAVDPVKFEKCSTFKDVVSEWNKTTNTWLYNYVYKRCGFINQQRKKPGFRANLATKLVSAIWHGIYPGYYMTFVTAALYTFLTRLMYHNLSWPEFFDSNTRNAISWIFNQLMTDYLTVFFDLYAWKDSLAFLKNTFFYGHLIIIFGTIFILFIVKPIRNRQKRLKRE
jgi:lysophospholipid acyltransferase